MSAMMQQQDDWLEPTRQRLKAWADWLHASSGAMPGGYGLIGSYRERQDQGQGYVPPYENNEAEMIDRILCKVRDRDQIIYQALFDYYYEASMSTRDIAEHLRVSKTKVLTFIKQGETMVSIWWDAIDRG